MPDASKPTNTEVDQLLLNAHLRDALEPFFDESLRLVDMGAMPTHAENEFLASMLAWEQAPILPISRWFEPELTLPHPDELGDDEIHTRLWETINRLYSKRIVLELTDHLSDRQLYCLIYRDILPSHEKMIDAPKNYLHWHCIDDEDDADLWLRFYATDEERRVWSEETNREPPAVERPPFPRKMPRRPN